MTILRKEYDPLTLVLTVIACLILATTFIVILTVPKPDTAAMDRRFKSREFARQNLVAKAKDNAETKRKQIINRTWNLSDQQAGIRAVASITNLVKASGLTLVSVRPQRRNEDGTFIQLPYLVTVEGAYPRVVALTNALEEPAKKFVVNLVQITSSDAASDQVTASIGLLILKTPPEPESAAEAKRNG